MANTRERRSGAERRTGNGSAADVIASRDNRWLKEFRVALRGGVPTASGAVGVEGVRLVEEALSSGCRVEAVLFGEAGERYRERLAPLVGRPTTGFPVLRTTDRLFESIADTEHPQGVAALVIPRAWTLEEVLERRVRAWRVASEENALEAPVATCESGAFTVKEQGEIREADFGIANAPLIVVLAGVQDPGNVGAILRTGAAFGATAAVTAATGQSGTANPFAPKAVRASAGAAFYLPIVSGTALGILLAQLKLRGIRTLASCVEELTRPAAAEQTAGQARPVEPPWDVDWCGAVAVLFGNEGSGLPEEVVRAADGRIHIPMAGPVESLNAAAAAAVVLYEAFRQRKKAVEGGPQEATKQFR